MNELYQIRVYTHRFDSDGIRENQLVGPIYTDKEMAEKDAAALKSHAFYYDVEVEQQSIAQCTLYC